MLAMSSAEDHLINLAECMAGHLGVTHWAISMRMEGRGDRFERLRKGGGLRTDTYARRLDWFSTHWPADLEWPADVPRPKKPKKQVA